MERAVARTGSPLWWGRAKPGGGCAWGAITAFVVEGRMSVWCAGYSKITLPNMPLRNATFKATSDEHFEAQFDLHTLDHLPS